MVQRPEILSIPVASTGPIFIVPELLAWTPGGSFRGHGPGNICAIAKHLLTHLLNPCDISLKAQE